MQIFQAIYEILKTDLQPEVRELLIRALKIEGDSIRRLVDDIITSLMEEVVPNHDEMAMYRGGERVLAITQLSQRAGITLVKAKEVFEDYIVDLRNKEIRLITQGKYIDAIKSVRERTGVGLVQAKFSVDCYDDGYAYLGSEDHIVQGDEYQTAVGWRNADNFIGQSKREASLIAVRRRK